MGIACRIGEIILVLITVHPRGFEETVCLSGFHRSCGIVTLHSKMANTTCIIHSKIKPIFSVWEWLFPTLRQARSFLSPIRSGEVTASTLQYLRIPMEPTTCILVVYGEDNYNVTRIIRHWKVLICLQEKNWQCHPGWFGCRTTCLVLLKNPVLLRS